MVETWIGVFLFPRVPLRYALPGRLRKLSTAVLLRAAGALAASFSQLNLKKPSPLGKGGWPEARRMRGRLPADLCGPSPHQPRSARQLSPQGEALGGCTKLPQTGPTGAHVSRCGRTGHREGPINHPTRAAVSVRAAGGYRIRPYGHRGSPINRRASA